MLRQSSMGCRHVSFDSCSRPVSKPAVFMWALLPQEEARSGRGCPHRALALSDQLKREEASRLLHRILGYVRAAYPLGPQRSVSDAHTLNGSHAKRPQRRWRCRIGAAGGVTVAGADDPAASRECSGSRFWFMGRPERCDSSPNRHPAIIYLFEHDLRANGSRLPRGKIGFYFCGSCPAIRHNFRVNDFIRNFSSQSGSAASVLIRSIKFS
jgi:hypothetical protein